MPYQSQLKTRGLIPDGDYLKQKGGRQVVLLMLILSYHLWFQMDFACPCNSSRNLFHCYSYLVLPSVIILSIILWSDRQIGRILRYLCLYPSAKKRRCGCQGRFCVEFVIHLLHAATSGFLWCGSVLVDGDWYVCCGNSEELMDLACMEEGEMGPAEQATKANLKNQSMVIGLICILLTISWSFIFALPWNRWCLRKSHFRAMLEEQILEQTETILWREMGKTAADAVRKSLANQTAAKATTTQKTQSLSGCIPNDSAHSRNTV